MIKDFSGTPASRWEFITDQVMGGVPTGRVSFEGDAGQTVLHLQGAVSTANNGGFIQARLKLANPQRKPASSANCEFGYFQYVALAANVGNPACDRGMRSVRWMSASAKVF